VDTNIIIYHLKGERKAKSIILDNNIHVSYITVVETLGYRLNKEEDIVAMKDLFSTFRVIYSNERIMNYAIELKREHRMKTPDCLIAATAQYLDFPLVSADADMFDLEGIDTVNFYV